MIFPTMILFQIHNSNDSNDTYRFDGGFIHDATSTYYHLPQSQMTISTFIRFPSKLPNPHSHKNSFTSQISCSGFLSRSSNHLLLHSSQIAYIITWNIISQYILPILDNNDRPWCLIFSLRSIFSFLPASGNPQISFVNTQR